MTEFGKIPSALVDAQNEVELQRNKLDASLQDLQKKIEQGREGFNRIAKRAKRVDALSEDYPVANIGVFVLAGFLLGGMIARSRMTAKSSASPIAEPGSPEPDREDLGYG